MLPRAPWNPKHSSVSEVSRHGVTDSKRLLLNYDAAKFQRIKDHIIDCWCMWQGSTYGENERHKNCIRPPVVRAKFKSHCRTLYSAQKCCTGNVSFQWKGDFRYWPKTLKIKFWVIRYVLNTSRPFKLLRFMSFIPSLWWNGVISAFCISVYLLNLPTTQKRGSINRKRRMGILSYGPQFTQVIWSTTIIKPIVLKHAKQNTYSTVTIIKRTNNQK